MRSPDAARPRRAYLKATRDHIAAEVASYPSNPVPVCATYKTSPSTSPQTCPCTKSNTSSAFVKTKRTRLRDILRMFIVACLRRRACSSISGTLTRQEMGIALMWVVRRYVHFIISGSVLCAEILRRVALWYHFSFLSFNICIPCSVQPLLWS